MKTTVLVILVLSAALMVCGTPTRLRRAGAKSARQLQASGTDAYDTKTPYPPAGFRPKVAFELPGERQPKAVPAPTTTATPTTSSFAPPKDDVEDFSIVTTETTSVESDVNVEAEIDSTVEARTPANTYGAPEADDSQVVEPSGDFQPPVFGAVEDFSAAADIDVAGIDAAGAIADLPTYESSAETLSIDAEEAELAAEPRLQQQPANTYGAPELKQQQQQPANTYGAPELKQSPTATYGAPVANDDVELDTAIENELTSSAEREVEVLSRFSDLRNGRLIYVPADGTQLRQLFVQAPVRSGKLVASLKSGRARQNSRLRQW